MSRELDEAYAAVRANHELMVAKSADVERLRVRVAQHATALLAACDGEVHRAVRHLRDAGVPTHDLPNDSPETAE